MKLRLANVGLGLAVSLALVAACGSNSDTTSSFGDDGGTDGGLGGDSTVPILGGGDAGEGGVKAHGFDVQPSTLQTIAVTAGQSTPAVPFTATLDGAPVSAAWALDKGELGSLSAATGSTASFVPRGKSGGLVTITAAANGQTLQRQVFVQLAATQNGASGDPSESGQIPTSPGQISQGGGVGGVGGEGLGPPVTDPGTLSGLGAPSNGAGQNLAMLYPYDATVWPRGMLAPLVMWSWTPGDADAIQIELTTTSGSFSYKGTFGRPAILAQTGGAFLRHPIPQDVWDMATNTAGGTTPTGAPDKLTLKLTVAKGGIGYGPITQTWAIAPTRLTGTVYYNSYGTQLVKNWTSTDAKGHVVGAAILGVKSGDLGPRLVVGQDSPLGSNGVPTDDSGCRVCHVVSSRGRFVLTQSEQGTPGDGLSFLYDLTAGTTAPTQMATQGTFAWAAMTSDGSYALTNVIDPSSSNPAINNSSGGNATSSFWQFGAAPTPATLTGLPANVAAGYPSYSPDDSMVAYVDVAGSTNDVHGPIMVADYDAATHAFANAHVAYTPAAGQRAGYPVFTPDNSGLLFEVEVRTGQADKVMVTRNGARSELWWVNVKGTPAPHRLDALVGRNASGSYLPSLPNNHGIPGAHDPRSSYDETGFDDTTLDYEPTILPIVEGGYAWAVFTSRRAYGNMLTAVPWQSWPTDYDITDITQGTVKKLWVAAIDLNAPAGADASHPAFYLPAQEILAGNSRGFWVLDPCKTDGTSCETGDQCCNGYCEPAGDGGALVCSNVPPASNCSGLQEKCTTSANCCDPTNSCINGFCAVSVK